MRILAFDCAGAGCGAAILDDGGVLAQRRIDGERGHARFLIPLLNETLADAGLGFSDIDRIAVTTGPGSFTGIRVALAAARGLALGLDIPVIGVTVFEALAAASVMAGFDAPILLVAVESRRAEIFAQLFDAAGLPSGGAMMAAPAEVAASAGPGPLALAGDAAHRIAPFLRPENIAILTTEVDPAILARLAARRAAGPPPAPFYLRAADAKPRIR
jgi:tRNA threonylcarbamoyladenosine biosynthesis protein TsaB